ncbi:hypothetical protein ACQJBY_071733 [Aegilops geniculata]
MGGSRRAFLQGKLGSLQLSEAEKKGVRITGRQRQQQQPCPSPPPSGKIQAVGKLLSEKPAIAQHVGTFLGAVWSPGSGVECEDLGRNRFLFTFRQEADKEKALDAGPWSFAGHLLVMEDFAPGATTVDELRFNTVPVWVRAYGVPAGSMSRETGELVGEQVGRVLEVDTAANADSTGALFMRIKVRMDITMPIMRFMTCFIQDDEADLTALGDDEKEEKIVAFTYENIPDFCYGCGIIGHTEKSCPTRSTRTGPRQFGPWLRTVVINKQASGEGRTRRSKDKAKFWPSTSITGSKQGSDGPSWRKDVPTTEDDQGVQNKVENRVYKAVKSLKQGTLKRKKGIQQNHSNILTESKKRRVDIMNVDEVIAVANKAKMETDGGEENAHSEMLNVGLLGQPGESK